MLIAATPEQELKKELPKKYASRTYKIGNLGAMYPYLLTRLRLDPKKQILNETINLEASAVVNGYTPESLVQYSVNSFMVCGQDKAVVLDVDTMNQLKVININTGLHRGDLSCEIPLIAGHMIPGTDYKFMLEFFDSQLVTIRNVTTGKRQVLI